MDDQDMQALLDAIRGKSAEEIEALIASSANAGAVTDPRALAAYLVSLAG